MLIIDSFEGYYIFMDSGDAWRRYNLARAKYLEELENILSKDIPENDKALKRIDAAHRYHLENLSKCN